MVVAAADAAILLAVAATAADIKFYPKRTRIVIQPRYFYTQWLDAVFLLLIIW